MNELTSIGDRLLVIYDGRCGLCNRTVRWLLRRDRRDRLRFVPSDSPLVAALLARHGFIQPKDTEAATDTVVAVRTPDTAAERVFVRSEAFLTILRELSMPWPAIAAFVRLIPDPVRDLGYRAVARNRYRIWGRLEACPIPTDEERRHFL